MTTINSIDLPISITLRGRNYPIKWEVSGDMSGWTGHADGLPDHDSAAEIEYEVWSENSLHCDVYADGTAKIKVSI